MVERAHTSMERVPLADGAAFRMREWLVEPALNRMTAGEVIVQVEPRVMRLLVHLATHAGHVVTRDALLEAVWSDVVVNEEALTRAVYELRRVLDDTADAPRFVETIRGRGYRLVAPVELAKADEGIVSTPGGDALDASSVAVMPSGVAATHPPVRWPGPAWWVGGGVVLLLALFMLVALREEPAASPIVLRPVPLTTLAGHEVDPALSFDGTRVAFAWRAGREEDYDVYVKQPDSETLLRLTDHPADEMTPAWSPDGSTVAFARMADSMGIYAVPSIGGPARLLISTHSWVRGMGWSPDGETLVFSERPSPEASFRLFRLQRTSRERRPLTVPPSATVHDHTPAYSPNGRHIAFVRSEQNGAEAVYLIPADGGTPRPLVTEQRGVYGLDWTPDGRAVVFSSYRSGTYSLWQVDVRTGALTWVPVQAERIYRPSLARQANALVFEKHAYEKNVWRIQRDNLSAEEPLITSTRWDCEAFYSPRGDRLVFTSARSGTLELWLAGEEGQHPVQLTAFEGPFVGNPRWAPDGRRIAFFASPNGSSDLFLIPVEGEPAQPVLTGPFNDLVSGWSRDGRWIYFGSDRSGRWEVWKTTPDGAQVIQVTQEGGFAAQESFDGQWLFFSKPNTAGLWRMPVAGGPAERILETVSPQDWGLAEDGIYFVARTPQGAVAMRFDGSTHEVDRLRSLPYLASPSFSVSPDGRSLLYARIERSESDLMRVAWQP